MRGWINVFKNDHAHTSRLIKVSPNSDLILFIYTIALLIQKKETTSWSFVFSSNSQYASRYIWTIRAKDVQHNMLRFSINRLALSCFQNITPQCNINTANCCWNLDYHMSMSGGKFLFNFFQQFLKKHLYNGSSVFVVCSFWSWTITVWESELREWLR
jgi:hypothetical protein